ncbi:MAG: hypothetical protein AEth_01662 [Candidatus Argoarchaeum ethanivorans]|uniref:Uncharacterized protein n=1 Tax=Candidatus Argoarchaeum ethanivorans TaxID=2608793 RepID=A0A8B3S159_9EURY|nr:MAG: hypothetical protein AEth_01662 [Candidatus Argoarchaeum ethanivorans]
MCRDYNVSTATPHNVTVFSDCSIPKLFRLYFVHRTQHTWSMVKMSDRKIRLAINWVLKKGETTSDVARDLKVSQRRIQQFVKHFKEIGEYLVLNMNRRPKTYLTDEQKKNSLVIG